MKYLLVVDTETTGLDPKTCKIVEVAAAIYHVPTKSVLAQVAGLIPIEGPNLCEQINRITDAMLAAALDMGRLREVAYTVLNWAKAVDAIVAHNAPFDRGFCEAHLEGFSELGKPWVCSRNDLVFPKTTTSKKLVHIAADHALVNPNAHRALSDVQTLCNLLSEIPDLADQLAGTRKPAVTLKALVSFDDKDKAKAAGFFWEPAKKAWLKTVRAVDETELRGIRSSFGFDVMVIPGASA